MAAQVTSSISTIFNGYTNPPITNPEGPAAFIPDLPAIAGRFFYSGSARTAEEGRASYFPAAEKHPKRGEYGPTACGAPGVRDEKCAVR